MSSATFNLDERLAHPPRYWWTRRIVAACLGMLLALAGAWLLWWKVAAARLQGEVAAIRARGERILPEEFNVPAVPDEINVAMYLSAAAAAVNTAVDSPRSSDMEYPPYLPMSDKWMAMAKSSRAAHPKAMALIRQARQFTKVDWKLTMTTPVMVMVLPSLNQQRHLANVMADVARYEHLNGDDFEALERLRDVLHGADAINEQPWLVTHLVAIGIAAMAIEEAIVLAPGLRIADDPAPAPTTQPVTPARREQVQALIQVLLSRGNRDRMSRIFQAERMGQLDSIEYLAKNSTLVKPMYRLDVTNLLREMQPVVAAASQPNLPAAANGMRGTVVATAQADPTWTNMLSNAFTPSLNRLAETDYRIRTDALMAAVVLAARLYQVDHQGQWPPNLDALVPTYLPSIPLDPMSSTGKRLGYITLNNGTRPLAYSVGPDDYDNTANGVVPSPLPKVDYDQTVDQWRDLSRVDPPPTTAPSPQ